MSATFPLGFLRIKPLLDERARRSFVAIEALSPGRGGVTAVAGATGIAVVMPSRTLERIMVEQPFLRPTLSPTTGSF